MDIVAVFRVYFSLSPFVCFEAHEFRPNHDVLPHNMRALLMDPFRRCSLKAKSAESRWSVTLQYDSRQDGLATCTHCLGPSSQSLSDSDYSFYEGLSHQRFRGVQLFHSRRKHTMCDVDHCWPPRRRILFQNEALIYDISMTFILAWRSE